VARRRALITGISGQDGSYLAEALLAAGYEVAGTVRPGGADGAAAGGALPSDIALVEADLLDPASLRSAVTQTAPDELYHLAAPTFVPTSWDDPTEAINAVAGGTATLLAAARERAQAGSPLRMFVAASSEVFGDAGVSPQAEDSPMRPRSPYGVAKLAALGLVRTMRERHGLHVSAGILYNHESPRRPVRFLPRKVTRGAAAIALGLEEEIVLGDLRAVRDWCHAADVARAAWLMLQQDDPGDYVVASGVGRTVGDLVNAAFAAAGVSAEGRVRVDPAFVRPPETTVAVGDPSRARRVLGWQPGISFQAMITEMVAADMAALAGCAEQSTRPLAE
jgi:GDPmannose 4,6-dehydratase